MKRLSGDDTIVGGAVALILLAVAGGFVLQRSVDGDASCRELPVNRVIVIAAPGANPEMRPRTTAGKAAGTATALLGYKVSYPCPPPGDEFVINALLVEPFTLPNVPSWHPSAHWAIVPRNSINKYGAAYVTKAIGITAYGEPMDPWEGLEPIALGIGERSAYRRYEKRLEEPPTDVFSYESLMLSVNSDTMNVRLEAFSRPGELFDESVLREMLASMLH